MTAKRLDVLLVLPPMYQTGRTPDYNPKEPMGLMYLAAELRRRGRRVEILDADLQAPTIEETVGEIVARPAAVIGFSVLQRALPSLQLVVEGLRQRDVRSHICCGGVGATLSAPRLLERLPGVDSVVMGDGELVFADLVERVVFGRDWRNVPGLCHQDFWGLNFTARARKPDLDSLALPVRDLLPTCLNKTGYVTLVGSRGCYAACTFCSNSGFERASCGPGWRGRNPIAIVDEIEYLHREFGVQAIKFNDPNLFGPGRRGQQYVELLCRELIRRELNQLSLMAFTRATDLTAENCQLLRQAGFERMLIGIETFEPQVLKKLRKGESAADIKAGLRLLQAAGISIVPGFIIFNPYTTLDSLERDLVQLDEFGFAVTLSKSMRIFDGTALQEDLRQDGRLRLRNPFDGYHEYTVRRDVATVYAGLKEVSVNWLAELSSRYQDRFWDIKKAPSFSGRDNFYSLQDATYAIESRLLRAIIAWVREDRISHRDVTAELERVRDSMVQIEKYYAGQDPELLPNSVVREFSVSQMSKRLLALLQDCPHDTFPEKYRWAND